MTGRPWESWRVYLLALAAFGVGLACGLTFNAQDRARVETWGAYWYDQAYQRGRCADSLAYQLEAYEKGKP